MLVSMPWEILYTPSLQLGTLRSVLGRSGVRTDVCSLKLAFMEHCAGATAAAPPSGRIGVDDYHRIGRRYYDGCLSDWIFAVPPFRDTRDLDEEYLGSLRDRGVPQEDLAKAADMRAAVPSFLEQCVDDILAAGPKVVAFLAPQNQFTPVAYSQTVPSLVLSKLLKARDPALKIVLGGATCAGSIGAALHRTFPWLDVVISGEAEPVLPALVEDLLAERPIRPQPGVCYRDGDQVVVVPESSKSILPMDDIPAPDYDEYFERLEKASFRAEVLPRVRLLYEGSRGCWWGAKSACTFCGLNGTRMGFRSKRPERVVEEMIALATRYGRFDFTLADTIMDTHLIREALPQLREHGYDFTIFGEVKANLSKEQIRLFREAGVDRIQPGIETLSTPILRLMRKGVTGLQNVRLLKWCAEYGVAVAWNFLYGLPGEPPGEYERLAIVAQSLTHLEPPRLLPMYLDRFSPYWERPREFGLEIGKPLPHYRIVYPVEEATLPELAHAFEYRHLDGRDPEAYVGPLRLVIDEWLKNRNAGYRSLRYRRGPGSLRIIDRRPNLPSRDYSFGQEEARIYLACEDGATPAEVAAKVRTEVSEASIEEIRDFLNELVGLKLVYEEGGRYLSLALPARLVEESSR